MMKNPAIAIGLMMFLVSPAMAQEPQNADRLSVWLPLQLIPSLSLYNDARASNFGFEWELTPVLYSFGMNDQISPWYSFIVEPTARFVGSIELSIAGQIYTTKLGNSYFSSSGQIMGFIPLSERGEHLTLNVGLGAYRMAGETRVFKAIGFSTLFGMLHFNIKHADRPTAWIGSFEFRIF